MYTGESWIERGDYSLSNHLQELISKAKAHQIYYFYLLLFRLLVCWNTYFQGLCINCCRVPWLPAKKALLNYFQEKFNNFETFETKMCKYFAQVWCFLKNVWRRLSPLIIQIEGK